MLDIAAARCVAGGSPFDFPALSLHHLAMTNGKGK
jgi:hypothetical protein